MNARYKDLAKQVRALSREEKEALVRDLIDDLDSASEQEIERLWVDEARRRYDEYLRGEVQAIPADEVMARLLDRP